jgi:hypothetical protein
MAMYKAVHNFIRSSFKLAVCRSEDPHTLIILLLFHAGDDEHW